MAKNIMIYEGAIHKAYADGIKLMKTEFTPIIQSNVVQDNSLYYLSFGRFVNMDYDTVLPSEEEAFDYVERTVANRKDMIFSYYADPNARYDDYINLLNMLASVSSCIYFNEKDVHPFHEVTKQEFKEMKKRKKLELKAKRK